jgi:hypothetical protein
MAKILAFVLLSVSTTIFIAILTGAIFEAQAPPEAGDPPTGTLAIIESVLSKIWQAILFVWNAVTFNAPGSPWYVRTFVATLIATPIVWGIATLIRGGGGE